MVTTEFLIRIIIFAASLYLTLEYVFVCDVNTKIGMSVLILTFLLIILLFYIFGNKKQKICV
jgi:hypothetical protein